MAKHYYLAGRMTGIPRFNFPRFEEVAEDLRSKGYDILSPAEMDDKEVYDTVMQSKDGSQGSGSPNGETWGDFLSRDVKIVADEADGVIAMDDWWMSKGARLEVFVATTQNKPIYHYVNGKVIGLPRATCDRLIAENM